jgi:hypothetical protein
MRPRIVQLFPSLLISLFVLAVTLQNCRDTGANNWRVQRTFSSNFATAEK